MSGITTVRNKLLVLDDDEMMLNWCGFIAPMHGPIDVIQTRYLEELRDLLQKGDPVNGYLLDMRGQEKKGAPQDYTIGLQAREAILETGASDDSVTLYTGGVSDSDIEACEKYGYDHKRILTKGEDLTLDSREMWRKIAGLPPTP